MRRSTQLVIICMAGLASGFLARNLVTKGSARGTVNASPEPNAHPTTPRQVPSTPERAIPAKLRQLVATGRIAETPTAELAADLRRWLTTNPSEAMAFVFHDLPAELSLSIIPELGDALARLPDRDISCALASVRTEREMRLAWQAVLGARLNRSPESAIALARLAPPLSTAGRSLVDLAAVNGGASGIMALVHAGADKSWLFPSRATGHFGPEWLTKIRIASGRELLAALKKHYADQWTDRDTLQLASKLHGAAPDAPEVLRSVVEGTLLNMKPNNSHAFIWSMALSSPDALKIVLDAMPEGFRRRKLALMATQSLSTATPEQRNAVAAILPPAESTTARRAPRRNDIELKAIMEPQSGAAYQIAASAPQEDRPAMLAHAAKWFLMTGGTPTLIKSLSGLADPATNPAAYTEVARTLVSQRPDGLDPQDLDALKTLTPEQSAALHSAVKTQSGSETIISKWR